MIVSVPTDPFRVPAAHTQLHMRDCFPLLVHVTFCLGILTCYGKGLTSHFLGLSQSLLSHCSPKQLRGAV